MFAWSYQPESASHSTVFFSHNKSASAKINQLETIQRTGWINGVIKKKTYNKCGTIANCASAALRSCSWCRLQGIVAFAFAEKLAICELLSLPIRLMTLIKQNVFVQIGNFKFCPTWRTFKVHRCQKIRRSCVWTSWVWPLLPARSRLLATDLSLKWVWCGFELWRNRKEIVTRNDKPRGAQNGRGDCQLRTVFIRLLVVV